MREKLAVLAVAASKNRQSEAKATMSDRSLALYHKTLATQIYTVKLNI